MAQTTESLSFADCVVEVSTNGSSWTDISGEANQVSYGGGARQVGDAHAFDGDVPIVTGGKRERVEVTIRALYTEAAAGAFETLRARHDSQTNRGSIYLRWSPNGGNTGDFRYYFANDADTAVAGVISDLVYPSGDTDTPDPIPFTMTVIGPKVSQETI